MKAVTGPSRLILTLAAALFAVGSIAETGIETDWLNDASWEDGAARVSVFEGRIQWYGEWRDAEIRHYLVREFLDAASLTKIEPPEKDSIPVLKVNVLTSFETGTYPYRQMASLFYDRRTGELLKAAGSSQEGCGVAFQRWDRDSRLLAFDTYWQGEGADARPQSRGPGVFFENELPVLASLLTEPQVEILPSITSSNVRDRSRERAAVRKRGGQTRVGERTFGFDSDGFLENWTIPGREEFRRVTRKTLYYWMHTGNGDENLLRPE